MLDWKLQLTTQCRNSNATAYDSVLLIYYFPLTHFLHILCNFVNQNDIWYPKYRFLLFHVEARL